MIRLEHNPVLLVYLQKGEMWAQTRYTQREGEMKAQGKNGHVTGWGIHKPWKSRTAHTPDARSSKEHFSPGDFRGNTALETS